MSESVDRFQKFMIHRFKHLAFRVDQRPVLENPSLLTEMQGFNRLCGDRITIYSTGGADTISLQYEAASCAICQVSADVMCETLVNQTMESAVLMADRFIKDASGNLDLDVDTSNRSYPSLINDLMAIRSLPSRLRCVTLPWETFSSLCKEKVCHYES